jgi:addiction module HigA family antidote
MSKERTKRRYPFTPDYAVPPGETLQETIDTFGMTQRDLALRTGMAPKTINEIIKGKAPITPDTAVLLERVTSVPARMWNNLEVNYREQLAKIIDRERLEADLGWLKTIPTKELIARGAIDEQPDKVSLLHAALQFFGVSSSAAWRDLWMQPNAAFRKSARFKAEPGATATWLRLGELEAQKIKTKPYDKAKFRAILCKIRGLTMEPPEVFEPRMVELCASAGVAVVFVREIKKCPASGVARWLTARKALIQLSLRYKTEDQFWFSFFHESGHILNDPKKEVYIDDGDDGDDEREERANRFAAATLIPPQHADVLEALKSKQAVVRFAKSIGISPGIVVGRLQKEGIVPYTHLNGLKQRFEWKAA